MSEFVSDRANTAEGQHAIRTEVLSELGGRTSRKALDPYLPEMGVGYSTIYAWLNGTYEGRNDEVATKLERWLDARRLRQRQAMLAPKRPDFIMTPSAQAYWGVLQHAQHTPDMVSIINAPGTGKTSTAEEYQRRVSNVWRITGMPAYNTPRALLDDLADVLDIDEKYSSHSVTKAIIKRLRNTGGLIIVDEAQHYTSESLDQLRSLHDTAAIGIALMGNEVVQKRLEGGARAVQFAQLFSRIGYRLKRSGPKKGDIEALIAGWGIDGDEERRELMGIAQRPGALRVMGKVLHAAHLLAAASETPLNVTHIQMAWERSAGRDSTPA